LIVQISKSVGPSTSKLLATYAILVPSDDQAGSCFVVEVPVRCLGLEPSAFMTQTCRVPPGLLEMNAILVRQVSRRDPRSRSRT